MAIAGVARNLCLFGHDLSIYRGFFEKAAEFDGIFTVP
jgi:hypothetical protein